jgi:CCR4-NOT transcription complex subunit 1
MYETEDLKMNIKFEVQVLCKNINIKIEDIQRTNQLTLIPLPVKDIRNPDFNVKAAPASAASLTQSPMLGSSPTVSTMAIQNIQQGMSALPLRAEEAGLEEAKQLPGGEVAGAGSQEQTVIPNLAAYVTINPSLQFFTTNPAQRRLVSLAVDRAIREIIQPVVERSVTIASVTTKQLILKDFSTEPNEQQLRNGAHMMIANLAGSLALVTCKEPLRVSIGNHLRSLLQQVTSDQSLIEQIVQVCSNDNLELGCMLIEKASTEKAISAVDESLAVAIQARRKSRETNQAFVDATSTKSGAKYPRELPDALKPNMGGLHPQQLLVYEVSAFLQSFEQLKPI